MKVLGLDLGVASIGWALIELDAANNPVEILGVGTRVVNLRQNEASDFSKGKGESVCSKRTTARTIRRGQDRYQLRRYALYRLGIALGMIKSDEKFAPLNPVEVWGLRAKAATEGQRLTLSELLRVLLHINQRRGYKHSKSDGDDKNTTDYVARVNQRYTDILNAGLTAGQYFYKKLKDSEYVTPNGRRAYNYRIKEQVLPRKAYEEEFDAIMRAQQPHYPEVLTDKNIDALRNAIFMQRPLKSCKHLVGFCEFERKVFTDKNGNKVESGPRVAPASSPLAQYERILEVINNIRLENRRNRKNALNPSLLNRNGLFPVSSEAKKLRSEYIFDREERQRIFEFMFTHEKMTESDLLKLLGLTKTDGFKSDKSLGRGLQGNPTHCKLKAALEGYEGAEELLRFDLKFVGSNIVDEDTGEVLMVVSDEFVHQPLYRLWHTLYSVADKEELRKALERQFGITDEDVINRLYHIDFVSQGYANKSSKFMRKLIPLLAQGYGYAEASARVGINHSQSRTKEENAERELLPRLELLAKNSLRQPTVEKILNQMINLVNAIKDEYGDIDEIRVELARELKQSKDERDKSTKRNKENEKLNTELSEKIVEFGIIPSRRRIQKMKMLEETGNKCMYCGKTVTPQQFVDGHDYEVEHIIPRSKVFNDSFSNKVCSCRECNQAKGNRTGYDFMESRPELFTQYINRVDELYKAKKISAAKYKNLLTAEKDIDAGFIDRDLRLTQYISKKARLILLEAFRSVYASSGAVTDFFRHAWGYDTILHDLDFEKYRQAGLTESVTYSHHNQVHTTDRIKDWSKRKDHRHHAIDAMVVALTRQGYVQRLSTLNAQDNATEQLHENLKRWAERQPHFSSSEVARMIDRVSVSFKSGKKLVTPGKRYVKRGGKRVCVQTGVLIPRDALHKETVYGRILLPDSDKKLAYTLEHPELIVDSRIRTLVQERLKEHGGQESVAKKSLKANPLVLNGRKLSDEAIKCLREEYVVKYGIDSITHKDIDYIIDGHLREVIRRRFEECGNNDKQFVKSLAENPIYSDSAKKHQVRSVRLRTGIDNSAVVAVRRDTDGKPIGYAQTRNNHHLAFYKDATGKIQPIAVSFWTAVKRKRYGIPIIVTHPEEAWDKLKEINDGVDREDISASLPAHDSKFVMSMAVNEMFILGLSDEQISDALATDDLSLLNKHLFRIQKLAEGQFGFSLHTSTTADMNGENKAIGDKKLIASYKALMELNAKKVRVDTLGRLKFDHD